MVISHKRERHPAMCPEMREERPLFLRPRYRPSLALLAVELQGYLPPLGLSVLICHVREATAPASQGGCGG